MEHRDERTESQTIHKTEARQGQTGFPRRVLFISLILIVLAFAVIYMFAEANDPPAAGLNQTNVEQTVDDAPVTPAVPDEEQTQ